MFLISNARGDAEEEWKTALQEPGLRDHERRYLVCLLIDMGNNIVDMTAICKCFDKERQLYQLDWPAGGERRRPRIWLGFAHRSDLPSVLLHVRDNYFGGLAETAMAENEARLRYDLEFGVHGA